MSEEYILTIRMTSDNRLPTWDVIRDTPNAADLLACCLNQTIAAKVESFTLSREGQHFLDLVLDKCVEVYRWP